MTGARASHGAWRVEQVRAAERELMARLPEGALMRRAAAGLARRCALILDGVYGRRVTLLVGKGDNGGDALYAGALLAGRGADVRAWLAGDAHPGGLTAFLTAGGRRGRHDAPDLVVDGLLGIGGTGAPRESYRPLIEYANATAAPVVAVDLPSGVDADTGAVAGLAVRADVTVTFGCWKPGLLVGTGARHAGAVELVDIGVRPAGDPVLEHLTVDAVDWPWPGPDDDKYTRGVVGVATGSATYPGAAVLSTGGALAGPVGYVRYAGSAADAVRAAHPEVVSTDDVAAAGRVQAWVVGSGLGTDDAAARTIRDLLASDLPVLLDADALTVVAGHREWLDRAAPTLVTPHDREFARLAGREVGSDRLGAARALAAELGITVLLKGDHTLVADPDRSYVVTTGVPDLASAGTGDVLGGLCGALLAHGVPALRAGAYGAFVHGLAGRIAAADGPVTAARVVDALRPAVRSLR